MGGEAFADMVRVERTKQNERPKQSTDPVQADREVSQNKHERIVENSVDPSDAEGLRRRAEGAVERAGLAHPATDVVDEPGSELSPEQVEREAGAEPADPTVEHRR